MHAYVPASHSHVHMFMHKREWKKKQEFIALVSL